MYGKCKNIIKIISCINKHLGFVFESYLIRVICVTVEFDVL